MAENVRPFIAVDNPPRRINLATINKQRKSMASNNTSAMDVDRLSVMVDTTRMQLISPPPEEMLRPVNPSSTTTAAKRKRTQPTATFSSTPLYSRDVNSTSFDNDLTVQSPQQQPVEATPNPKPRKQGRLHSRQPSLESPTGTSFRHLGSSPISNGDTHTTPSRSKTKVVKSPHPNNPDADFIDVPALVLPARRKNLQSTRSSRRSATPFIPYEPPTDVFTPPREVFLSPVTKSSKRKTVAASASSSSFKSAKGKKKGSTLTIVTAVKQELPDIDLTLPMPPPSPSDDPLLLLGPPEFDFLTEPTPSPRKREMSVQVQTIIDEDLPPSSPIAMDEKEAVGVFDWDFKNNNDIASDISTDDEEAEEQEVRRMSIEPEQLLELNEEEEADEQEVRRMSVEPEELLELKEEEEEGHEFRRMSVEPEQLLENEEVEEEQEVRRMSVEPEKWLLENEEEEEEEQEVRRMSVEPERRLLKNEEQEEEEQDVRRMSVEPEKSLLENEEEEEEEEEQEVRRMSVEPERRLLKNEEQEEEEEQEVRRMSIEPEQLSENEEEQEHEVRQISVEVDNNEEFGSPFDNLDHLYTENPACGNKATFCNSYRSERDEDDDQISDDSDELSHGIVKITSADPRSAARAAAILKQHDYDCYTNIEIKQRHQEAKHRRKSDIENSVKESRRRDVFSSGVAKVSNSHRRRRSTLSMGVIGDRVFIPGSPAMTLPELLQEAELEVKDSPWRLSQRSLVLPTRGDPFLTPIAAKFRMQTADQKVEVYGGDVGEREWTKDDWKHLDACFTDQRLEIGSRLAGSEQNMLASVDTVSIDDVVDKFVISKGGFETITRFGELWSRENLLERTRALQKKQRSGKIAPPTTPYSPSSVVDSNGDHALGGKISRIPLMQIPDFTPLGRRATLPRKSRPRPILLQSDLDQESIVIPPTLLAPRYSHLLEEAIAISQDGSTLSPEQVTFPRSEINDTFSDNSSTIAINERGLTLSPEQEETLPQCEVKDTSHSSGSNVPATTIGKRVKGLLISYLPTLPKLSSSSTTVSKAPLSVQPSLPLPPIEILSKPRGPITTPARAPILKPKHPKELVVLHPAPQPPTISHIPRLKKPQRLVELKPPAPPPMIEQPIPRPRRSSGSSVKDLVRGFEEIQAVSRDKSKYSVGWKTYTGDIKKKPQWKP